MYSVTSASNNTSSLVDPLAVPPIENFSMVVRVSKAGPEQTISYSRYIPNYVPYHAEAGKCSFMLLKTKMAKNYKEQDLSPIDIYLLSGMLTHPSATVKPYVANLKNPIKYLVKASTLGFAPASYIIGLSYESGYYGLKQNCQKAVNYYNLAIEQAEKLNSSAIHSFGFFKPIGKEIPIHYDCISNEQQILASCAYRLGIIYSIGGDDIQSSEDTSKKYLDICKTYAHPGAPELEFIYSTIFPNSKPINHYGANKFTL